MKVDYICTQWPLGPDKGPSAASRLASCVFLISYCFSQREGHLLIDCLNPLQINTAGSLCDAYPSSPSSPCLEQARGWGGGREGGWWWRRDSIKSAPHFLTQALSLPQHLFHCLCLCLCILWGFFLWYQRSWMSEEIHSGRYPHINAFDALYELWNESGFPHLVARLHRHLSTLFYYFDSRGFSGYW